MGPNFQPSSTLPFAPFMTFMINKKHFTKLWMSLSYQVSITRFLSLTHLLITLMAHHNLILVVYNMTMD